QTARGSSFTYDANGNLLSTSGVTARTHVWTRFDLPASMGMSGRSMAWAYGTDRQRVQSTLTDGSVTRTIHYLHPDRTGGLFYERQSNGSTIENRHFISAGGVGVIGVVKTYGLNNPNVGADPNHVNDWHKDHLGSLVAVSNASGAVLDRMAYDAWGKRMQPNGTADPDGQLNPASTDRGFTGHEHLDELGFVHMNGRIDDPLLGRFLSPDPHIQDEGLLQNYNRYSYVLNNPLRYTDPSGEVWWHVAAFIVGAALASSNNRDLKVIGTIMMMAALATVNGEPGLLQMLAGKDVVVPATASAFGSAAIANTIAYGPEAGLKAGVLAAAFAFVGGSEAFGELKKVTAERVIAHAVLGCVQQASSGGQCGPGAAAAAFGKIATGLTQGLGEAAQFAVTTVVGGTVSVIGGGKFANGAAQAGFGYLFNHITQIAGERMAADLQSGKYRPNDDPLIKFVEGVGDVSTYGMFVCMGFCQPAVPAFAAVAFSADVTVMVLDLNLSKAAGLIGGPIGARMMRAAGFGEFGQRIMEIIYGKGAEWGTQIHQSNVREQSAVKPRNHPVQW
ncbi:MAG: RHS repeat domain-containing protein, partial [Betaproteobacteria bacterium]